MLRFALNGGAIRPPSTAEVRYAPPAAAVSIGFALAACVLVAGPVSGGAGNPARALGPMIVSLKFYAVLAYIFGPIVGGVLGAVVYDKFIAAATAPDPEQ
jgi:glycerol uptake facilitator-like aquaporin